MRTVNGRVFWVASAVGAALCSGWLFYCWYDRRKRRREIERRFPSINRVLFFPDRGVRSAIGSPTKRIQHGTNFFTLLETLDSAEHSLDVCVFTISSQELGDVLINAHLRGVVVRVITDNEQLHSAGSQVERLRRAGIQVRTDNSSYFMHHKFVVVDSSTLVSGSLNWTLQGVHGNQENVIVTNNPALVHPFVDQFDHLWRKYDPLNLYSLSH